MAAMGTLLLGLLLGGAIGYFVGRRQAGLGAPGAEAAPPRIAPAPTVVVPPGPSKKARRLGISEVDFVPADDILQRMQEAWEQGEELALDPPAGDADGDDAPIPPVAPAPAPPPVPPAAPAADADLVELPDPVESERVRRVLAHLEGQAPEGEAAPFAGEAPSTVSEAVTVLASEGYGEDLHLDGGQLACTACGTSHPTNIVEVDRVLRFEGPSDPGDEAIVLALRCPACGTKGSLVSAFGPDADPELAEAFVYLSSRARHR
jgi:hypothetical protein